MPQDLSASVTPNGGAQVPEPPYVVIGDGLRNGKVIPFLGAGASLIERPEGTGWSSPDDDFLPTAGELAGYLDRLSGFPSTQADELTRVAQYFDGIIGRGSLDDHLHKIFSRSYEPGPLHRYLASFPNLLVVTTNYDRLLETAFQEAGNPFRLVVYKAGPQRRCQGPRSQGASVANGGL